MRLLKILLPIIIILLFINIIESVDFDDPVWLGDYPENSRDTIITSENIYCRWNASSDTTKAVVTWYKNSAPFGNNITITYPGEEKSIIDNTELVEEDTWNCTVVLFNSSNSATVASDTIYVDYDPLVYIQINSSYIKINNTFELYEDSNYNVIWNTTNSHDNDFPVTGLCTGSGSSSGSGTCSPNSSHLGTDKNTSSTQISTFKYEHSRGTQKNKINFTIIPINDPPSIVDAADDSIEEDDDWTQAITISDEEGNFPVNLTVEQPSFCSYTPNVNRVNASGITFNCSNPGPTNIGNYTINISVVDNPPYNDTYALIPQNISVNFTLEVVGVNHIPNITYVSNFNSSQNLNYTILMNATDRFDNNTLNFSITGNCNLVNPWTNVTTNTTVERQGNNFNSSATGIWNRTLNNSHIVCRNITVTVTDALGATNSTTVYLNISNVNDPPVIENYSSHPNDLLNNNYIYNLTAYASAPFIYQINATDPDLLVIYDSNLDSFNESLFYESNSTWLNNFLNNQTGLINISADNLNLSVGNYSFLINVTDNGTISYSNTSIMNIEVKPNDPPQFNQTLNFTCFEFDSLTRPQSCYINLNVSEFTYDSNIGDSVANFSDDSDNFNISNYGIINFNATQDQIGLHTFNITIIDTRGATNTASIYIYINNTNNKPNIISIEARTLPNALYYNKPVFNTAQITVYDLDLNLTGTDPSARNYSYDQLTLIWANNNQSKNLSGYISISPNVTNQTSSIYLIINATKTVNGLLLATGEYSINITVTDNYYNYTNGINSSQTDTYMYNFTVYNVTTPPIITFAYPYGSGGVTVFGWQNVTDLSPAITYINITENQSLYFNHSVTDDQVDNLTFKWYYDGVKLNTTTNVNYNSSAVLLENNHSINFAFGFFEVMSRASVEAYNLTLVVVDGFDSSLNDTFTWHINVTDKNRRPVLNAPIPNITVEGSRNIDNKDLWTAGQTYGFYDPDFDLDSDGTIDIDERNFSITYSIPIGENGTLCQGFATLNVTDPYTYILQVSSNQTLMWGHGIKAIATANGSCNVTFTASDGEYNETSNVVFIDIIAVSSQSPETVTTIQGSTRSTRTITETVTIPIPEEVEKPIPIDIVLPDMVTVYENNSMDIPLTITNTWDQTIYGVHLDYRINKSMNYSISFKRQNFYQINPGEKMNTIMTVSNYRIGGVYEIIVLANVTDPEYVDSAKIYLNSIEQTTTGSQVRTLIKFARDLLQKHKECQEIGEVLIKAEESSRKGDLIEALKLANAAVNGCKYLISEEQVRIEKPSVFRKLYIPLNKTFFTYILVLAIAGLLIGGGYLFIKSRG